MTELRQVVASSPRRQLAGLWLCHAQSRSGLARFRTSSHAPASRYCRPRACCWRRMHTNADPSPTHFPTLDRQWCHDSHSFPRSIPDSARALMPHADGAELHRTAPAAAFQGARTGGSDQDTPSARHDLISDVEAHVDGLASLALVFTNRPLTHFLLCRSCRSLVPASLYSVLFYSFLLCVSKLSRISRRFQLTDLPTSLPKTTGDCRTHCSSLTLVQPPCPS